MSSRRPPSASLPESTARYLIEARVGGGGMGDVYRALDRSTQEIVAIKLLKGGVSPHEGARFRRECAVLADLRHPNVVRYIDHGLWTDGRPYLAMEWLDGEDLEARRKREPPGMRDAVEAIRRAAAALAAVHARGVIHRDIKLSNLWLCERRINRVKLIDFGVVKLPEDDGFATQPGAIVGTPHHMAPEQARNEPISPSSDIYSLGSVLFFLLTGRLVFPSDHLVALLGRLVLEDAPRVSSLRPEVPDSLDQLVARCLHKDPAERFQDGGELARALARVGELGNEPPPSKLPGSLLRPSLRSRPPSERPSNPSERRLQGTVGRRLVAVVLASLEQGLLPKDLGRALRATMTPEDHLEPIQGERLVLVLGMTASGGDEALRAARLALLISRLAPGARVAFASGHVREAERGLSTQTLERAAQLLEHTEPGAVRIDRETAPLLGTRFRLQEDARGTALLGEEEGLGRTRQLLGRPTPTVGRDQEFAGLATTFQECLADGQPRAVLVSGPAGIGKSRLRYELSRWLRAHPEVPDILLCRGAPLSDRSGLSVLGRALRVRAGIFDGEDPAVQLSKLRSSWGPLRGRDPQSEAFFCELLGVRGVEASEALQAARQSPALMQGRLQAAFEVLLRSEDRRAAQVLILEDCHWIDELTRSLVGWVLRASGLRFVVFAFARPELRPDALSWPLARHIELGPLSEEDARRLVREALPALDEETGEAIVERAGGNALFLEELIRYAAEGHEGLPLTVQAVVQLRLDAMAPALRGVARAASVFGRACWSGGVEALAEEPCLAELEALAQNEILTECEESRFAGQREWSFRHALVREAIYASLLDEDRACFHGRAARWLEAVGEEDLATLAWHVERGGDLARAGELYVRATSQAQAAGYLDTVLALADSGLACTGDPVMLGKLLVAKARAMGWMGHPGDAISLAHQAQRLSPRGGRSWVDAVRVQAAILRDLGRQHESEQVLAAALAGEFTDTNPLGPLLAEQARTLADLGKFPEARRAAEGAMRLAEYTQDGQDAARLRALDARFFVVASQGLLAEQIEACLAVVQLADALGDIPLGTRARCNLGHSFNCAGRFEEAFEALSQAATDASRSRILPLHGFALHNLGLTLARLGRFDEAIAQQHGARALAKQMGHERLRVSTLQYEALCLAWQGHALEQAQALAREACRAASYQPAQRVLALRVLAFIQFRRRVFEASLELLGEPGVLPAADENPEWGMLVRWTHAQVLASIGQPAQARASLRQGYTLLLQVARSLHHPHRQAFLERIPEHQEMITFARAWGVA